MKLLLTRNEFEVVREIISNSKDPIVISNFNKIFDKNTDLPIKGAVTPKDRDILIEANQTISVPVLQIFVSLIANMVDAVKSGTTLSALSKWKSIIESIQRKLIILFATNK